VSGKLGHLYAALSAHERGLLLLRNYKEGREQDRLLLWTAPERQVTECNRIIGLINAASGDLAHLILLTRERVAQTELRHSSLVLLWVYGAAVELPLDMERPL
jgi:hypothetical protein